ENRKHAKCRLCGKEISAMATSNLTHHLSSHHREDSRYIEEADAAAKESEKQAAADKQHGGNKKGGSVSSPGGDMDRYVKAAPRSNEDRNLSLLRWIARDLESLDTVESNSFCDMVRSVGRRPNLKFPSLKTIIDLLFEEADYVKAKVKDMVEGQLLSLTTDAWASLSNMSYVSVTTHWGDKEILELKTACLTCRKMEGSHTAKR
ncbi:unnamed protein product, partial [Discosporangium mesarthrocarpum]